MSFIPISIIALEIPKKNIFFFVFSMEEEEKGLKLQVTAHWSLPIANASSCSFFYSNLHWLVSRQISWCEIEVRPLNQSLNSKWRSHYIQTSISPLALITAPAQVVLQSHLKGFPASSKHHCSLTSLAHWPGTHLSPSSGSCNAYCLLLSHPASKRHLNSISFSFGDLITSGPSCSSSLPCIALNFILGSGGGGPPA